MYMTCFGLSSIFNPERPPNKLCYNSMYLFSGENFNIYIKRTWSSYIYGHVIWNMLSPFCNDHFLVPKYFLVKFVNYNIFHIRSRIIQKFFIWIHYNFELDEIRNSYCFREKHKIKDWKKAKRKPLMVFDFFFGS